MITTKIKQQQNNGGNMHEFTENVNIASIISQYANQHLQCNRNVTK